ncbi:hypothetical protein QOZ80_9AG0688940 [Eleusine coracana subsp. coracana]|nr:hypothetical protein QOZ80_9AG0688940 [Eleusine coracana subsp. coracana]
MPASIDDDIFLNIMNGENFGNDMNPTLDVDVEDFGNDDEYVSSEDEVPQKKIGRGSNFTAAEDKTLVNIAQRLYKGKPNKKGGKAGKAIALQHCWVLLEHDEKWRTRNIEDLTKSKKSRNSCSPVDVDSDDEDDGSGRRSPTPISAPSSKRPSGRKVEKKRLKKAIGENAYKESLDNMVRTRKELAVERNEYRSARWMEMKEVEERRTAAEERRTTAEERRAVAEERRAVAEKQRAVAKRLEQEQRLMFMDPSNLDEKERTYFELIHDQVLASRSMGGF